MSSMSLRHALLGLLADRPASGYDLLKRFDISLAAVWPAAQSQLYAELNRLAADELVKVAPAGPRGRKEYTLTDAGLAELRRWLIEVEPRQDRRNEALLRVFFLGVLTKEQALDYLAGLQARARTDAEELRALDASITWDEDTLSTYGRLAIEYGHRIRAAQRDWARWAIERLTASTPS
jgi:PadR family transcriptional regulator AphA